MLRSLFLNELFNTTLTIRDTGTRMVENLLQMVMEGNIISAAQPANKHIAFFVPDLDEPGVNPYDKLEENSIAVIPLTGMMMKYGYWWRPGVDMLADLIRMADASERIVGTVLLTDTPGGTTSSVIQMEDAMRNRTKPCVGLIDGECCSGGVYVASFCDELYAMNRMCEVGSIGTYAQIIDTREADKKWGYRVEQIYPPESKYKNLPLREAMEGKPERLIREELSPYAIHFQNIIKANRPNLDASAEGILEGKVFYAYDAVENGLIDGIMNMQQVKDRVKALSDRQQLIYSQFNL